MNLNGVDIRALVPHANCPISREFEITICDDDGDESERSHVSVSHVHPVFILFNRFFFVLGWVVFVAATATATATAIGRHNYTA